jgi:hypothetical protein
MTRNGPSRLLEAAGPFGAVLRVCLIQPGSTEGVAAERLSGAYAPCWLSSPVNFTMAACSVPLLATISLPSRSNTPPR